MKKSKLIHELPVAPPTSAPPWAHRRSIAGGPGAIEFVRYAVPPWAGYSWAVEPEDFALTYRDTLNRAYSLAGTVQPQRFWRLRHLGDPEVFTRLRAPSRRLRLSVMLLWDFSNSQSDFVAALLASLASVGSSLQRAEVSVWAAAYTDSIGVDLFEVCGWGERWDHRRVAALAQVRMNGTPTAEAMEYVRRVILPRAPHRRRLLIVCTDGAPNYGPRRVTVQTEKLRALGVTVAGLYVGGGTSARVRDLLSSQYGLRYSFAADREDIPRAVNQILGRVHR